MKTKTRDKCSKYNPIGEKLKNTRPPTFSEILKLSNYYQNPNLNERNIVKNYVIPDIMEKWSKVHNNLPLKSEKKSLFFLYVIS